MSWTASIPSWEITNPSDTISPTQTSFGIPTDHHAHARWSMDRIDGNSTWTSRYDSSIVRAWQGEAYNIMEESFRLDEDEGRPGTSWTGTKSERKWVENGRMPRSKTTRVSVPKYTVSKTQLTWSETKTLRYYRKRMRLQAEQAMRLASHTDVKYIIEAESSSEASATFT